MREPYPLKAPIAVNGTVVSAVALRSATRDDRREIRRAVRREAERIGRRPSLAAVERMMIAVLADLTVEQTWLICPSDLTHLTARARAALDRRVP